ncbi:MAG: TRAP transporter substrate-binding protein [Rhodospirillales bacterium]|jgi:TRAP-type C4-dicarboxylate transport system substrate-binding protein|nr:TRAP transporter substrate-binding protein [Rhodospirillales bacterium]
MTSRHTIIRWGAGAFAAVFAAGLATTVLAAELRVAGNFSGNKKHVDGVERPFFEGLAKETGLDLKVNYNPMDMLGIKAPDALRLLKAGAFDVMSVQTGMAARDDAFFEGLDIAGVAPDMKTLRKVVDAYRDEFDARLQKKFNAKVLTLWPFGPQVLYCNGSVNSLEDLKGKKVRTFTASMAQVIESLGGTSITLQFPEVYPSLQKGVADCAVTAPTAGNSANWPEVSANLIPLALSGSVQGHFMNLDTWKKLGADGQAKIMAAFKVMEEQMWDLAVTVNDDAVACNTGEASCKEHAKFSMKLVDISPEMLARVKETAVNVTVPQWAALCNKIDPNCSATWNKTAGAAADIQVK